MRTVLAAAGAVLGALLLAATASAATRRVPAQYDTIQEAVDAASSGDTIAVSGGVFYENVTVNTSNLKIVGKNTILDATVGASNGTGFTVNGNGVTIQGFRIRNGSNGVYVQADDCHVLKCTFTGQTTYGAYVSQYPGFQAVGCVFTGQGNAGIYANGTSNGVVVTKCQFRQAYSGAIYIYGDDARVEKCGFTNTLFGEAIYVSGASSVVKGNKVVLAYYYGIEVSGDDALVDGNSAVWCWADAAIYVSGSGSTVSRNKAGSSYYGFEIYGNGNTITGNSSVGAYYYGLYIGGDDLTVTGNFASQCSDDYGIYVYSYSPAGGGTFSGNRVEDCPDGGIYFNCTNNLVVSDCSALRCGGGNYSYYGIYVCGTGNTFANCTAAECSNIGIYVSANNTPFTACKSTDNTEYGWVVFGTGNSLVSCVGSGNGGNGLMNGGTNTVVNGGVYLKNRMDIALNPFNGATFSGGLTGVVFATGGALALSENWQADD